MARPVNAREKKAASSLAYRHTIDGCLATAIGDSGLTGSELSRALTKLAKPLARLSASAGDGSQPLFSIVEETSDIEEAEAALAKLARGAETIVFYGTGGSSLGGETLAQLAGWNIPGDAGPAVLKRPRTRFYDNLDPRTLERALKGLDLARARFVVTSKSGGTAETLAQMVATLAAMSAAGLEGAISRQFLVITEPAAAKGPNPLRKFAEELSIPVLPHHPGIGGRFSGLSNVGLLPAMSRGLNARLIRKGAAEVVAELVRASDPSTFAPAVGAAATVTLMKERGIRTLVMLPYADRLGKFSEWWVQLWAESLGKEGQGSSPVAALGPLDQHSQLQLWMEGPPEHLVTVIRPFLAGTGPRLPASLARRAGIDMLAGRTIGDLVAAQAEAIPEALRTAGRPVRLIELDEVDERSLGALMMHFFIETILAAALLGVDPFGQPGVELGKRLAREKLEKS
ncbi:MAG: glucose-6-phosphate isomerase [Hyphomicrobiaceae bacterium]|nr:MAG: glucose-6-phosphate isomerase [Hyphomicrobiaceae bacterium]